MQSNSRLPHRNTENGFYESHKSLSQDQGLEELDLKTRTAYHKKYESMRETEK